MIKTSLTWSVDNMSANRSFGIDIILKLFLYICLTGLIVFKFLKCL